MRASLRRRILGLAVALESGSACRPEASESPVPASTDDRLVAKTSVQARVRLDGEASIPEGARMRVRVFDLEQPERSPSQHERRLTRPEELTFLIDVENSMQTPAAEIEIVVDEHVRFATAEPVPLQRSEVNELVVHVVASSLRGDPTQDNPFAAGMPTRP